MSLWKTLFGRRPLAAVACLIGLALAQFCYSVLDLRTADLNITLAEAGTAVAAPLPPTTENWVALAAQLTARTAPPAPPSAAAPAPQQQIRPGQKPGTIRLPDGTEVRLVRKEIAADGSLPIPDGVNEATWWGAGLEAGQGATVLAGHVNWQNRIGPFEQLWRAAPDQRATVRDVDGTAHEYAVSEVHTVTKQELPNRAAELFDQQGPHRLVLVTCGGRWIGGRLGYDENRIVVLRGL
ncbi:class F sortase [Pseudonocardiaceae bacterium YIM PH 21723]|nr:class F sortase [Pseudonocardiaceae bacterium YIM PH 21723]